MPHSTTRSHRLLAVPPWETKPVLSAWDIASSLNRQPGTLDIHQAFHTPATAWQHSPGKVSFAKGPLKRPAAYPLSISWVAKTPSLGGGVLAASSGITTATASRCGLARCTRPYHQLSNQEISASDPGGQGGSYLVEGCPRAGQDHLMDHHNDFLSLKAQAHAHEHLTIFTMGIDGISITPDFWKDLDQIRPTKTVTPVSYTDVAGKLQIPTPLLPPPILAQDSPWATIP